MKAGRSVCYLAAAFFFVADFLGSAPRQAIHAQNTVVDAPIFRFGDSSFVDGGFAQPLGGNDAGARLGFSILGGGGALNFNLTASQGSSRSMVGATPLVVVGNGGTGTFMHGIQRPFVVGFTPVVGGWSNGIVVPPRIPSFSLGPAISPLQERVQRLAHDESALKIPEINAPEKPDRKANDTVRSTESRPTTRRSSAEQPDTSVAQIRRQQDARDAAEEASIAGYVAAARLAEAAGDLSHAVKLIDKARRESQGARRHACEDKIRSLRTRIRAAQSE